ncbi:hypothetical protein R69888_01834 [Paraburkholderia haematera]|uniref:Uncharacterized protein n=1 Tax=Paraburkholderia haematera TaxID=2793077 RepID=A0ABN7L6R8_9BURK|nr:hypothetical protein R69888_01834 [Paraburkholderia haematera]
MNTLPASVIDKLVPMCNWSSRISAKPIMVRLDPSTTAPAHIRGDGTPAYRAPLGKLFQGGHCESDLVLR